MTSTPSSADGTGGGGGVNLNAAIAAVATTLDISNDLRLSYETRFAGLDKLSSAYIKGQTKSANSKWRIKRKYGNYSWLILPIISIQMTALL